MPITTIYCHGLGAHVTRVTDFEGHVMRVICPEYEEPAGICRLRRETLNEGPLGRLLERVEEDALAVRGTRCTLQ